MQLPGMSILGKSLDLRQDNTSQQEEKDVSPLDSEEHKVTLVGGGGNGGRGKGESVAVPSIVWRGRQLGLSNTETRQLQQLFPLSQQFTFPNPQVCTCDNCVY